MSRRPVEFTIFRTISEFQAYVDQSSMRHRISFRWCRRLSMSRVVIVNGGQPAVPVPTAVPRTVVAALLNVR